MAMMSNKCIFSCVILVGLLFVYLFILQLEAVWPFTIDDMYISLRYARHWASGQGLVWNIGELPVEGYSNFILVVIGALALLFKLNAVMVLKWTGVVGLFLTCYFVYQLARFWFLPYRAFCGCLPLLCYQGQIIWAVSGLETTLYEALITGATYCCFKGLGYLAFPQKPQSVNDKFFIGSGVLLALAGLTRPEAPIFMVLFFILSYRQLLKANKQLIKRSLFLFGFSFLICYGPYFLWRLYYFGYFFPNSIYCKGYSGERFALDKNYLQLIWPWVIMAIPAFFLSPDKRYHFLWLPSLIYLILLKQAEALVAFDNRLFLTAFILLIPLAMQGLQALISHYFGQKNQPEQIIFYFIWMSVTLLFIPKMTLGEYRYFSQSPVKGEQLRLKVVAWLKKHAKTSDQVVLGDSGLIPYYSTARFIDSYCLNNRMMAHTSLATREVEFCQKMTLVKPQIFILTSLTQQDISMSASEHCLQQMLKLNPDYRWQKTFQTKDRHSSYRYDIYQYQKKQ